MKIGVIDLKMQGWSAGRTYAVGLAHSLQQAGADMVFLSKDTGFTAFPQARVGEEKYLPGEWSIRSLLGLGRRNMLGPAARSHGVVSLGPVLMPEQIVPGLKNIGWIPDLQPLVLSQLYSRAEVEKSERRFRRILEGCDRVIVSSEDSRAEASRFFPGFESKLHVLSFPSLFAFEPPGQTTFDVREKYDLPERFILVANQFWRHKNQIQVVRALGELRRRGKEISCVMTGLPADFRDRDNAVLSELLQELAMTGAWDNCRILGLVPRGDLVELLRSATALVQPSRFEGWNTTVQDAVALGCPVIASDLPVHREQVPSAAGFFPLDDHLALADILESVFDALPTRPNPVSEKDALAAERRFAETHGMAAVNIFS